MGDALDIIIAHASVPIITLAQVAAAQSLAQYCSTVREVGRCGAGYDVQGIILGSENMSEIEYRNLAAALTPRVQCTRCRQAMILSWLSHTLYNSKWSST